MNPSLVDRFASDASRGVQVSVTNCIGVSISNPCHLSFSSSHVRSGYINTRSQETLLGQLDGKPTSDLLQLVLAVQLGVDLDAGFASTKWDVNTGTLVGHQSGKSFHFIRTPIQRVTDTTLTRTPVMRVLSSIS